MSAAFYFGSTCPFLHIVNLSVLCECPLHAHFNRVRLEKLQSLVAHWPSKLYVINVPGIVLGIATGPAR